MKTQFEVRVVQFSVLREIEGIWTTDDFIALLEAMEIDGISELSAQEIYDVCLMALQDLKPEAAAEIVLHHHIAGRLTKGEIRNVAHEMVDQKLWEEYANLSLHERMFNVGSLMYAAFPRDFPEPDAVSVSLELVAANEAATEMLAHTLNESFLVRLLADGMDDGAALNRLFDDQLDGDAFADADKIVWIARSEKIGDYAVKIEVISSGFWLDALRDTRLYVSSAHTDNSA